MTEPDLDKELKLKRKDAASFLRELAESIEEGEDLMLEGEDWKVYQPHVEMIPFRITQDKTGLEVDLKIMSPGSD